MTKMLNMAALVRDPELTSVEHHGAPQISLTLGDERDGVTRRSWRSVGSWQTMGAARMRPGQARSGSAARWA